MEAKELQLLNAIVLALKGLSDNQTAMGQAMDKLISLQAQLALVLASVTGIPIPDTELSTLTELQAAAA